VSIPSFIAFLEALTAKGAFLAILAANFFVSSNNVS